MTKGVTGVTQLGMIVGQEIEYGELGIGARLATEAVQSTPGRALPDVVTAMVRESRRKRPRQMVVSGLAYLLGQGLESLRHDIERGDPDAAKVPDALGTILVAADRRSGLDPGMVMVILREFQESRVAPPEPLTELLGILLNQAATDADSPAFAAGDIAAALAGLVRDLDGDIFAVHGELSANAGALPAPHRLAMALSLLHAEDPSLRETAVGWLLDDSGEVRRQLAEAMAAQARTVSGVALRRMIAMRNWLSEADRPSIDAAIKACRRQEIACAAAVPAKLVGSAASGIDGAGAQSLFVVVKEGRKHAVASLLVRHGAGILDAWVRRGLSKREADSFMDEVEEQVPLYPIGIDYTAAALGHFLSINLAHDRPPPFGLLDFAETVGITAPNPAPLPVEAVVEDLLAGAAPMWRAEGAAELALADSGHWPERYPFLDAWFEDDHAIGGLIGIRRMTIKKQVAVVLERFLPGKRRRWAEMLAWSALTLRRQGSEDWVALAVVARELLGSRPLGEVPLMGHIAALTVEAWRCRQD